MLPLDHKGYFITGSDTDVGKTYIACQIVRQLRGQGRTLATRKPAESGCEVNAAGNLIARDAHALHRANDAREPIERITPYRLRAALAPHRAARLEERVLYLQDLVNACQADAAADCLLVEGAGGFYSPLAEDGLNADLAGALQLPVVIVVADRVGAVNQALLTLQAVESRQLQIAAIILNRVRSDTPAAMDNAADLKSLYPGLVVCCGHASSLPPMFEATDGPV